MKATPLFAFPFPEGKDKPAGPEQMQGICVAIEERLELLKLLVGTHASPAARPKANW